MCWLFAATCLRKAALTESLVGDDLFFKDWFDQDPHRGAKSFDELVGKVGATIIIVVEGRASTVIHIGCDVVSEQL